MHKNMNLKIKTSESSKKNSLKIAFLLYFLISVQFVFAQNQTIDLNMTDKPLSEIFKSIENKPTSPLILTKRKSIFIKKYR